MTLSITGQEKGYLLIQVTAWTGPTVLFNNKQELVAHFPLLVHGIFG